jgi:hypothetical protein
LIKFSTVDGKRESSFDQVRLTTYGSDTAEHLGYFFVDVMKLCEPVKKGKVLDILIEYMDQEEFDKWYLTLNHSKLIELVEKQD